MAEHRTFVAEPGGPVAVGDSFAHLHVHTEYSMLDGASRVDELMSTAAEQGMPAMAMTDHGNLFGAIDFYKAGKRHGVNPIIGCLRAGQEIMTAAGSKPVEHVACGEHVLTHRGRFRRVTARTTRPFQGRAYEIQLAGAGQRTMTLTEEHPVLIRTRDGLLDWKKPGDIDAGRHAPGRPGVTNWQSWVCLPKLAEAERSLRCCDYLPSGFSECPSTGGIHRVVTRELEGDAIWPWIPCEIPLDPTVAYVLGMFVANGSLHKTSAGRLTGGIGFSFASHEQGLASAVVDFFEKYHADSDVRVRNDGSLCEVHLASVPFAYLFAGLCGVGAANTKVPEAVFNAPREVRTAFLRGLLGGDERGPDAFSNAGGQQTLRVASPDLAWGLRTLLADEGQWATVTAQRSLGARGQTQASYTVAYQSDRADAPTLQDSAFVYKPVQAVREMWLDEQVFNLEVEEDNSYVSDFVVHNCELYVAPESRFQKGGQAPTGEAAGGKREPYYHLTLLAENNTGYRNLIKLSSLGYLEGYWYKPRVDHELLAQHSEGLICLSGCLGAEVNQTLLKRDFESAQAAAAWHRDVFGPDHYFVELQDHGIAEQRQTNGDLMKIAETLGVGLVVTNDSHYTHRGDAEAHDALLCIQTGAKKADEGRLKFKGDHFYVKPAHEMHAQFPDHPETWKNTLAIAERCDVEIDFSTFRLPKFACPDGLTESEYLRRQVYAGAAQRYGDPLEPHVGERLEHELAIIEQMGYSAYFLIVADLCQYARDNGIRLGPGRGSAAGCAVSYCTGITDLDPLTHDLIFERFLNPERVSMPDIDLDFDERRRSEMIRYATEKYGSDKVAQIVTFSTIKAKQAIKDAARVLGHSFAFGEKLTKMMPAAVMGREATLDQAREQSSELREAWANDEDARPVLDTAKQLEGLRRQHSIHAAGVVIAGEPITDVCPVLQIEADGEVVTQYDGGMVEDIGLLKMDFLGLRNLTVISDALGHIERTTGERIDIDRVALDDPATYHMLARGETDGVFQLDSAGITALAKQLRPDCFADVVALLALYRPGPMSADLPSEYCRRKHGDAPVTYPHPDLEEILEPTYGILVYQEQVLKIAQSLAGFTLGEADMLRRAIGKKKADEMAKQKQKFLSGMAAAGYDDALGQQLWEWIEGFADYAFNKSHSAGYGLVSYQTAWLKANYPVEYMSALLTSVKNNKDRLPLYLHSCRTMGLTVLQPDVNESDMDFTPVGGEQRAIRFGLSGVRNVGEQVVEAILAARHAKGAFTDFADFCHKVEATVLNKRTIESLIKAGAFTSLGHPRLGLLQAYEPIVEAAATRKRDEAMGQFSLFAEADGDDAAGVGQDVVISDVEYNRRDKLVAEREMLGLYVSDHPLFGLERELDKHSTASIGAVAAGEADAPGQLQLAGILTGLTKKFTKAGEPYMTGQLEDLQGQIDVIFFPSAFRTYGELLEEDAVRCVSGRLDDGDPPKLIASDLTAPDLSDAAGAPVVLSVAPRECTPAMVEHLKGVLDEHPGAVPVEVHVHSTNGAATRLALPDERRVGRDASLYGSLKALLGAEAVTG
jgi:DNA polymerase-3 subunit alpha